MVQNIPIFDLVISQFGLLKKSKNVLLDFHLNTHYLYLLCTLYI